MTVLPLCCTFASADEGMLPVDCVINPSKTVDLSAAVSGVLESISVNRSDFVEQGQEVARLESSVELASVELATKRANINAEVHLGEINLGFDQREKKRIAELYDKKAVSYRIKDEADREAKLSEWELQQARDLEDIRWLELKRAHAQLAQKVVVSPISGFVTKIHRFEGEYVEDQPIVRVVQLNPLFIEAIVPMKMFGRIRSGMQAEVAPETVDAKKYLATVTAVDRLGDTASGTFGVRLALANDENKIPAGLKCGLRFIEQSYGHQTDGSRPAEDSPSLTANEQAPRPQLQPQPQPQKIAPIPAASAQVPDENAAPLPQVRAQTSSKAFSISADSPNIQSSTQSSSVTDRVFHYRFGPIESEQQLELAQSLLSDRQLESTVESGSLEKVSSYIVLATGSNIAAPEDANPNWSAKGADIVDYLRQSGIDDFQLLGSGVHTGKVSLGVLYTLGAAEQHQAYLARRGIGSVVKPRQQSLTVTWLVTRVNGEADAARLIAEMDQLSVIGESLE